MSKHYIYGTAELRFSLCGGRVGWGVSPGDLSVCVYCASVNEYIYHDGEQALLLVPLSDEAIEALPANARKELHRARRVVAGVRLRGLPGDKKA